MVNHRLRWSLGIIGVIAVAVLSRPLLAHAAGTGISLTTSPVVLNLAMQPGTTETRTLQLMNNSSQPVKIDMELDVFSAKGENGDAIITAPAPNDPSIGWVSFSPSTFVAKPGVWSPVKMTLNLPKNATLGYYYAVLFKPDIPDQPSANTTVVRGTNGILVLVDTHSGNEKRSLDIEDFSVGQGLYEYLPTTFNLKVHNGGNIYTAPTGNIYISQNSDLTSSIAALDINPGEGNVLPQSTRDFKIDWDDGFPIFEDKKVDGQIVRDAHGNPEKQLSWSFAKFSKVRIGQYYAKVTLIYNDGKRIIPISRVVSFWVIPWKLMLITAVILVVLVIGLLSIGRFMIRVTQKSRIYRR